MFKIVFKFESGEDVTIFAADGEKLLDLARKANVTIDAPCSGNGSCGKCRVLLQSGTVGGDQPRHINDFEHAGGWRLACASIVNNDAELLVPDIASAYKNRLKVTDLSSPAESVVLESLQQDLASSGIVFGCGIRALSLTISPPGLDDTTPDNERLCRAVAAALGITSYSLQNTRQRDAAGAAIEHGSQGDTATKPFDDRRTAILIPYAILKKMPEMLRDSGFNVRCLVFSADGYVEILDLLPVNDTNPACGLAIDVGTTTVSGLLVDLETGVILAKANTGNSQIRYGADVINRIIEQQKPGGIDRLQQAIVSDTLLPLINGLCQAAGISPDRIYRMTIASNTTMNHLLLGINANFLRTEPYVPAFFELEPFDPSEIGIQLAETAKAGIAPNIGSYVGGDITAGTLACMMWNRPEMSMLIDLGTNGEIVFGNSDFMMSCACSAGPAFEGGDISCGMRATDGAIEACTIDQASMEPEFIVIGGEKPVGLCGSGLIDVIAELFTAGIINARGKLCRDGARIRRDEYGTGSYVLVFADYSATGRDIAINEVDIDNFIRAKGAVFSAIMSLISPLGFTPEDVDSVKIAGGIGSGINIKNAIRVGMLPDLNEDRYSYIGNSSLSGAYSMLVSEDAWRRVHEVAANMTYIELSTQPGYMDEFIAACFLPHTDLTLFPSAL